MTKEKVLKLLKGVNSSKSACADGIHPHFIKETAETLTIPVFILFNKSLSEGSLPDIFKKANVAHIHKSGDNLTSHYLKMRGWTGGAGVWGWRVRNRGWRVRNRGWRVREAGVEGAGSGDRGGGEPGKIGAGK